MNHRKRLASALCLSLAIFCLVGCSTKAPVYTRPAAPVPAAWPAGPAYKAASEKSGDKSVDRMPWQEFFVDAQLRQLIILALQNNRDLKLAALNIERSRALYRIRQADLLPKVDALASASFQRIPEDLSSSDKAMNVSQYTVGLGISSYELDLFGRVQSLKDQALSNYLATEQARQAVQIGLISSVAVNYLSLAADRERLHLAEETLSAQEASYKLIKRRVEVGTSSELDLRQAQTRVEGARVDIARLQSLVAQDVNALNLLVGSPVPAELLPVALSETLTSVQDISPGLSSEVLLRRPDILQAENLLKGMNANIGAARAAFFPRITLVSTLGLGSDELTGLFKSGSLAWSFVPRVSLPIFDSGSNQANLQVAEKDRDIALAQYEKAIQAAFREVVDALAQRGTIENQMAAQQSLAEATAESYRLSMARFDKGVDSYLVVLDSQRSLYGAQQGLISTRLTRLLNLVTLYKVLGGGGDLT